jgi:dUTP diphosphatase
MQLPIKRFDKTYGLPERDPRGAACFDLTVREPLDIAPGEIGVARLNVAIAIPDGYAILMFARSSTPHRKGLMLANGVAVFDPYFSSDEDEYRALFYNFTREPIHVAAGDTLVQGMLIKPELYTWQEVESMPQSGGGWDVPERER